MLGLQIFLLIVALKFSREFGYFLTIQQLLLRQLALNSLENFKVLLHTNSCKCCKWFLRAGYLDVFCTKLACGYGGAMVQDQTHGILAHREIKRRYRFSICTPCYVFIIQRLTSPPRSRRPGYCHPLEPVVRQPAGCRRVPVAGRHQAEDLPGHLRPDTSAEKLSAKRC